MIFFTIVTKFFCIYISGAGDSIDFTQTVFFKAPVKIPMAHKSSAST